MAKAQIKINREAIRQILKSEPVHDTVTNAAKKIAAAAGGESMGYMVTPLVLEETRAATSVMATGRARADNRKNHSLTKALWAGGK